MTAGAGGLSSGLQQAVTSVNERTSFETACDPVPRSSPISVYSDGPLAVGQSGPRGASNSVT